MTDTPKLARAKRTEDEMSDEARNFRKSIRVGGVWIRAIGKNVELLVKLEDGWHLCATELLESAFGHIVEPSGIINAPKDYLDTAPRPAPATPAATPMAAPGLVTSGPIEIKFHDRESWLIHHFEEFIAAVAEQHEHKSLDCGCQTCDEIGLAKWSITASEPAAARPDCLTRAVPRGKRMKRDEPIKWNPYNKVVQDHRDGTIDHEATNRERSKRGLPVPWEPRMGDKEVREAPVE